MPMERTSRDQPPTGSPHLPAPRLALLDRLGEAPLLGRKLEDGAAHLLHEGDVRDLLRALADGSVHLIITSPPYNIGKEYESPTSLETYLEGQLGIATELARVLHPKGSLCWQVGNFVSDGEIVPLDIPYYNIFKRLGLKLRNRVVWTFDHGLHASRRFSGRYETVLWFTKSDDYVFNLDDVRVPSKYPGKTHFKPGPKYGLPSGNPKGKNPSDIWRIVAQDWEREIWDIPNVKANHKEKTEHPCQYPIELIQRFILALTSTGDIVLDPFAGAGSALLAAALLGRRGYCAEISPPYCEIVERRFRQFVAGELPVRKIGTPIHQPTGREKVAQRPLDWAMENKE